MDVAKAVSQALKNMSRYARYDAAKKFANRMYKNECRIRDWGCNLPGGKQSEFSAKILFGPGSVTIST